MKTEEIILTNGRHKGERITRIPISYLKWIANTPDHYLCEAAKTEMKRRGTVTPEVDVSGHALDRASLRCRKIWHEDRGKDEGLYSWLCRITLDAILLGEKLEGESRIEHKGMILTITKDGNWPVLMTIWPSKKKTQADPVQTSDILRKPLRHTFTSKDMEWDKAKP